MPVLIVQTEHISQSICASVHADKWREMKIIDWYLKFEEFCEVSVLLVLVGEEMFCFAMFYYFECSGAIILKVKDILHFFHLFSLRFGTLNFSFASGLGEMRKQQKDRLGLV